MFNDMLYVYCDFSMEELENLGHRKLREIENELCKLLDTEEETEEVQDLLTKIDFILYSL